MRTVRLVNNMNGFEQVCHRTSTGMFKAITGFPFPRLLTRIFGVGSFRESDCDSGFAILQPILNCIKLRFIISHISLFGTVRLSEQGKNRSLPLFNRLCGAGEVLSSVGVKAKRSPRSAGATTSANWRHGARRTAAGDRQRNRINLTTFRYAMTVIPLADSVMFCRRRSGLS